MRFKTDITVKTVADLKNRKGYDGVKCTLLGNASVNDGGYGEFIWDGSATGTTDDVLVIAPTGLATGRWIRIVHNNSYKAEWWGLVPDGTDQSTKLNAMFNALPSGARLEFPYEKNFNTTAKVILPKPIKLYGNGSRITYSGGQFINIVAIMSSNVKIHGLKVTGDSMVYAPGNCISTEGATNTSFYENIEVIGCEVNNFRSNGINLHYVNKFKVNHNKIYQFQYAGIFLNSCIYGCANYNEIEDILGVATSGANAYGIALTSQNDTDVMTHDVDLIGNKIKNVPTWEGIDTHGSYNMLVMANEIIDAKKGIAIVFKTGYISKNIRILDNTINNEALDQPDCAIQFQGTSTDYVTGQIVGNTMIGSGTKLGCTIGVLYANNQTVRADLGFGVYMIDNNYNTRIVNSTFEDIWHKSSGNVAAIKYVNGNNQATIEGNVLLDRGYVVPSGWKNRYGFAPNNDGITGNTANIGHNDFKAATVREYDNVTGFNFMHKDNLKENVTLITSTPYAVTDRDVNLVNGVTGGTLTLNLQSNLLGTDNRVLYINNPTANTVSLNLPLYSNPSTYITSLAANTAIKIMYSFGNSKVFYIPLT